MERQNTNTSPMPRSPTKRPKSSDMPEIINARRTESLDAPAILKLVQPNTESLFGRVNVVNLIEKASLAVTLCNDKDEVLGHASFYDFPNLEGISTNNWESWLWKYYDLEKCNALNTVFLQYFVSKGDYSHGCAEEIIRTMFNAVPSIHYCLLSVPIGVFPDASLSEIFEEVKLREGLNKGPDNCALFICYRHQHAPVLHIRKAKVEDHDDLTPIFNRQTEVLKHTYGDFFLAELIEAQDDKMKCLVAEVEGTAVGFLSVSEDVNVKLLNECFELGPYHGFCRPTDEDVLEEKVAKPASPPVEPEEIRRLSTTSSKNSKVFGKKEEVTDEEIKIRRKTSDDLLGGEEEVKDDLESARSEASDRQSIKEDPVHVPKTPKPASLEANLRKRFLPTYCGESLAVCIQLFCIDERFEMRSGDFMYKVFEYYPNKEFCIITVPHMVPEFPLLQLCSRAIPRSGSVLPQELYVFSKSGLLNNLKVNHCVESDVPKIQKLVDSLCLKNSMMNDVKQYVDAHRDPCGTKLGAYIAKINDSVVALAILRNEENIEYIRSHYNVEDFIYFNQHARREHVRIHHFACNPAFKHLSKHILKEVMRLFDVTSCYYYIYPPFCPQEKLDSFSLVGIMSEFVPVRGRRQIQYNLESLGKNVPSERILEKKDPFALLHLNRKLMLEPKVTINARIVVIGASDTSISFLETLLFCPHLKFNNITVISPHGLPGELSSDDLRDTFLSSSGCYMSDDYYRMSLRSWCNIVYGKMTKIDRRKKLVWVNGQFAVPYDHMIVGTGNQYQVPAPNGANTGSLATSEEAQFDKDRRWEGGVPRNLFTVNDYYESAVALYWLDNFFVGTRSNAIVYGYSLDSLTCIRSMIELGVDGSRIHLVIPPRDGTSPNCFNNPEVENSVFFHLSSQGVTVHRDFILALWNDTVDEVEEIQKVSFTSNRKPLELEAGVFFAFHRKDVDYEAFRALNDACLVYDGRLVIDSEFHTNDCTIRGAGPVTKYQRAFQADDLTHAEFNSKEVGAQLAQSFLTLFDPTLDPDSEPAQDVLKLVPLYKQPKTDICILPGNLYYLRMRKSGIECPIEVAQTQKNYGRILSTGQLAENFFSLHINQYGAIETVTCVSQKPLATTMISCIYGLHERLLNNLVSRYDEKLIPDLFDYFNETWAVSIYHDRFTDLRDEIRELLSNRPKIDIESIEEKVRALITEEEDALGPKQRRSLLNEMDKSGTKKAVETRLLSFLTYNHYHLPMYARPGML